MKPVPQPEFDFENELPPGKEFFSVRYLALLWRCSVAHVIRLVEAGEMTCVDLRGAEAAHKSMMRLPRATVVAFLNRRKR